MGIYIPKEFPTSCHDCPCTDGWNCFADEEWRDIEKHCTNHTKPEWCSLVGVDVSVISYTQVPGITPTVIKE